MEILTEWTCEELLVAYGIYANQNSSSYYDMLSKKERYTKGMTQNDRWAMPFVTMEQLSEMNQQTADDKERLDDAKAIAEAIFG